MKVHDLIALLQQLPPDADVVFRDTLQARRTGDLCLQPVDVFEDYFAFSKFEARECRRTLDLSDDDWNQWQSERDVELGEDEDRPDWWDVVDSYRNRQDEIPATRLYEASFPDESAPGRRAIKRAAPARRAPVESVPLESWASNSGHGWAGEGDARLREMVSRGLSTAEIASSLGRSIGGIRQRARKIDLKLND